jgi:hypothetical protein
MRKIVAIIFASVLTIITLDTSIARSGGGSVSSANKTVQVNGYTRKNGTHVNGYFRAAPGEALHPRGGTTGSPAQEMIVRQPGKVNSPEASEAQPDQPAGYFVRDRFSGKRIFVPPGYGPPMGGQPNLDAPAKGQLDRGLRYVGPYDPSPPVRGQAGQVDQ